MLTAGSIYMVYEVRNALLIDDANATPSAAFIFNWVEWEAPLRQWQGIYAT